MPDSHKPPGPAGTPPNFGPTPTIDSRWRRRADGAEAFVSDMAGFTVTLLEGPPATPKSRMFRETWQSLRDGWDIFADPPTGLTGARAIAKVNATPLLEAFPPPAPAVPEAAPPILSRPEISATVDRMLDDVRAAMVPHLGERLARDAVYGPANRLAPWQWEFNEDNHRRVLRDSVGHYLIGADFIDMVSTRVLTESAPEMEALLRELLKVLNEQRANIGDVRARMNLGGLGSLLDRIDKAGK